MRIAILIAALVLLAAGVALSYLDKTGGATATYAAGILCLVFVYLSQFKRFKGFGMEAELLEKKIEEADEVLRRLREITVPIAHMLFSVVARMGRWDSMVPRRQRYEIMEKIEGELQKNGVPKEQLEAAKRDWHNYNIIDLARPVIRGVSQVLDDVIKEKEQKMRSFPQPITPEVMPSHNAAVEEWRRAQAEREDLMALLKLTDKSRVPDEIERFLSSTIQIPDAAKQELRTKHKEQLDDLRHYVKFGEFRRLEEWFLNRDE